MTSEELAQAYADQLAHRRAANCYDIYEAAELIALQLGLDESRRSKLQDDLGQAAFDMELTVRSSSGHDRYAPTNPPNTNYGFDALTTPDDVNQWAAKRGFNWRWNLEHQATIPSLATTAPVVAESIATASDGPAQLTTAPAWALITSLERTPGYRWPLYQFLREAHVAGKPCPKAQEVLDAWKLNPPSGLAVIKKGRIDLLEYERFEGGKKTADSRAIQASIKGLTVKMATE